MKTGIDAISERKGQPTYEVAIENLHEEEGFNARIDYGDIDSFAKAIADGANIPPLKVRYDKDEKKVFIVDGHRRRRASLVARDKYGANLTTLTCFNEERGANEASRTIDLFNQNGGKPLTAVEQATVIARLIAFKWTISAIAKRISKSQPYVSGLLKLQEASKELHEAIQKQTISTTAAVKLAAATPKEQVAILKKLSAVNLSNSKKTIKVRDVETETKGTPAMTSTKHILEVEKEVEKMVSEDRNDHKTWVAVLYGIHLALKKTEFSEKFKA